MQKVRQIYLTVAYCKQWHEKLGSLFECHILKLLILHTIKVLQ